MRVANFSKVLLKAVPLLMLLGCGDGATVAHQAETEEIVLQVFHAGSLSIPFRGVTCHIILFDQPGDRLARSGANVREFRDRDGQENA